MLIGVGLASALGGIVAVALRQPYGFWYALLLLGVLVLVIFPFRLRHYQDRYREFKQKTPNAQHSTPNVQLGKNCEYLIA
jgi:hypothetical protein